MNQEKDWMDPGCLPFDLSSLSGEYGEVLGVELECSGVYFLQMSPSAGRPYNHEMFLVMTDAPISQEARSYGMENTDLPGLLFYEYEGQDGAWKIIEYELLKYRIKNKLPLKEFDDLHIAALYGAEVCPAYFGAYPVPSLTPWGHTTRHKTIHNGVYWIETDQCVSVLAISYVMRDDFSAVVIALSTLNDYDREHGQDKTLGPLFFQEEIMCLPLLELLQIHSEWDWSMINRPALMNAAWEKFPEYAAAYNLQEQQGNHDFFGILMQMLGEERELHGSPENMITLTPEAGTKFLNFL